MHHNRPCAAPADPRSSSESSERWGSAAQQARQHPWAFCAGRISQPICSCVSNASRTGLSSFSVLVSLGTFVLCIVQPSTPRRSSAPFQWSAPVSRSTILGSCAVPCTAGLGGGGGSLATLPRGLISALGVQVHIRAFSQDHRRSWSWQDSLHPSISFAWPQTRPPVWHSSLDRLVHFFHSRCRLGTPAVDLGGQR